MLKLRGHHLLCLNGFRGKGYSRMFVENMQAVHDLVTTKPHTVIQIVDTPDDICRACLHSGVEGCTSSSESAESRIAQKDRVVIDAISLSPGDTTAVGDALALVRERFAGRLGEICSSCQWYALGWCEEGLVRNTLGGR